MTDASSDQRGAPAADSVGAPSLTATADSVITGTGYLPGCRITIRVTYIAEDVSDYLTYIAGPSGDLHGCLPTSPTSGPVRITATDHRPDPKGVCGLLWSNTHTLEPRKH
jgi:hypothetical protein